MEGGGGGEKRKDIACVASVSAQVRRERLGRELKKGMTGEGEGKEGYEELSRSRRVLSTEAEGRGG